MALSKEQLGNRQPAIENPASLPLLLAPGVLIRLPDGRQTRILQRLPDGSFQTAEGVTISPDGHISGIETPVTVLDPVSPAPSAPEAEAIPETAITHPESNVSPLPSGDSPDLPTVPEAPVIPEVTATPQTPEISLQNPRATTLDPQAKPESTAKPTPGSEPETVVPAQSGTLTLVELLPMTPIPQAEGNAHTAKPKTPKTEGEKREPQANQPLPPQHAEKKDEKISPAKEKPAKKPKVGEELRIPPEAAKTGNLDFLEGCWQGTRPEYFSKRTIRECFCFGAHGGNGKRRVIDPKGGRMCIGASTAKLGSNGVLTVKSSGAA
ncbi:MAG: hypothetical protein J5861_00405, partial [Desulfovibrio sp.]|nr:hypothetical protein [Desulfovibrio sp.]